jgi:hypothetical protein
VGFLRIGENIFSAANGNFDKTQAVMTMVGGKLVFAASPF